MVYFLYFQPQKSPWLFVHISPTSQDLPSSSVQPVCGRFKRDRTRSLRCCLGPLKSWIPSSPRSSDHISLACLFVAFFKQLFFGRKTPNTYVIHNDFIWNIEYACLKMCFRINTINILDYIHWINWYFDLVRKPIHFGVLWLPQTSGSNEAMNSKWAPCSWSSRESILVPETMATWSLGGP